jgi:hypothetical protein
MPDVPEPLERIADSLENIEKILTDYYTAQSIPTGIINIEETKISKRDFKKLKEAWIEKQKEK